MHPQIDMRKDAGVVDRDGLENRCTLTGTQGSNPCLSANVPTYITRKKPVTIKFAGFYFACSLIDSC